MGYCIRAVIYNPKIYVVIQQAKLERNYCLETHTFFYLERKYCLETHPLMVI